MAAEVEAKRYLQTRQLLKDRIRRKFREEAEPLSHSCQNKRRRTKTTTCCTSNLGSFFGPSEMLISRRVIRESKNGDAEALFSACSSNGKLGFDKDKNLMAKEQRGATFDHVMKGRRLKESRDYCFLFPDEEKKPIDLLPSKADSVLAINKHESSSLKPVEPKKPQKQNMLCKNRKTAEQQKSLSLSTKKEQIKKTKTDCNESERALAIIRKMFNTERFAGRDDSDAVEESNFRDIIKEEKRSSKLAREEDKEQERLIAEEERRERMAKKCKLQR